MTLPKFGQTIVQVDLESITNALGALTDAAHTGDPDAVSTAMAYLKQIINTLEGTAGIPAFPAAAAPGNGVSIAEVIRYIAELVDSAETPGPYSYLDAGAEQDVVEDLAVTRRRIWLEVGNRNMTLAGTFRLYRKVDGVNYDLWNEAVVTVGAGDDRAFDYEFTTNQHWKLTYEESADEGAARDIPFNVITQVVE